VRFVRAPIASGRALARRELDFDDALHLTGSRIAPIKKTGQGATLLSGSTKTLEPGGSQQMEFSKSITDIIQERYSCRSYEERPIADETRRRLAYIASSIGSGPLGTSPRFELVVCQS
jgi:hypothetical protein